MRAILALLLLVVRAVPGVLRGDLCVDLHIYCNEERLLATRQGNALSLHCPVCHDLYCHDLEVGDYGLPETVGAELARVIADGETIRLYDVLDYIDPDWWQEH